MYQTSYNTTYTKVYTHTYTYCFHLQPNRQPDHRVISALLRRVVCPVKNHRSAVAKADPGWGGLCAQDYLIFSWYWGKIRVGTH